MLLRAGALPAPLNIVEERTVGPSLGADSIKSGRDALIIAFISVLIFILFYYKISGIFANIALFLNFSKVSISIAFIIFVGCETL